MNSPESRRMNISKYSFITLSCLLLMGAVFSYGQEVRMQYPPLDSKIQGAVIDSLCLALNDVYIFADVAKNMEKLVRENFKSGKYKSITNLAEYTERLRPICNR